MASGIFLSAAFFLVSLNGAFATESNVANQILIDKFNSLDSRFYEIRTFGKQRVSNFKRNYLGGFKSSSKRKIELVEFLAEYQSGVLQPVADFEKIRNAAAEYLRIVNFRELTALPLNSPHLPGLYRTAFEYGIGLLFNIEALANRDISNRSELQLIKEAVLKEVKLFFFAPGYGGQGLEAWDLIYFSIAMGYQSNFEVDVLAEAARRLEGEVSRSSILENTVAAATLLLEVTMLCEARCTPPGIHNNSIVARSLEDYKLGIFMACERSCGQSDISFVLAEFFQKYLRLLRSIESPHFREVRNKVLWGSFLGYCRQFPNIFEMKGGGPFPFRQITMARMLLSNLGNLVFTGVACLLFIPGLYFYLLIAGYFLIMFIGSRRVRIKSPVQILRSKYSSYRLKYFWLPWVTLQCATRLGVDIAIKSIPNILHAFKSNQLTYKLGTYLVVMALTLFFSDVQSLAGMF